MAPLEKADLLQGTLDLLILKVVALGPVHGYGIAQRIRQISKDVLQVQQGSLYPALHRLEKRGWLKSELGRIGKRPSGEVLSALGKGTQPACRGRGDLEPAGQGCRANPPQRRNRQAAMRLDEKPIPQIRP